MYEYIKGDLVDVQPSYAVVDCGGVGYGIHISLNTYTKISAQTEVTLLTHLAVREDAHILYGFATENERALFRSLISVSGVGAVSAMVMLSSLTVEDVVSAIQSDNVTVIKGVKGIGVKTAQKIIIELKDKVGGAAGTPGVLLPSSTSAIREEAQNALITLGFPRATVVKALDKILGGNAKVDTVEELIKLSLKQL